MTQYICINGETGNFHLGSSPEAAYTDYDDCYGKDGNEEVYELGNHYIMKTVFERVNDNFEGVRVQL